MVNFVIGLFVLHFTRTTISIHYLTANLSLGNYSAGKMCICETKTVLLYSNAEHTRQVRPSSDVVLLPCELNSGIKFDKSTAEARRLNQTFELSSALNYVRQALPCYTTLARQRFKRRASAVPNKIHKLH